jgi:hypothetical protein
VILKPAAAAAAVLLLQHCPQKMPSESVPCCQYPAALPAPLQQLLLQSLLMQEQRQQ